MSGHGARRLLLLSTLFIALLGALTGAKDCDFSGDVRLDGPVTVHVVTDDAGNVVASVPPCAAADAATDAATPPPADAGQCVPVDAGPSTPWVGPGACPVPQYYPLDGGGQRVVAAGDSMAGAISAYVSQGLRGHAVENLGIGGVKIADLPDVAGVPAWIVLSIGTNDLGSGNPTAINANIDAWISRQVANGHRVFPVAIPRRGDVGVPTQAEPTRQAVNAHLVSLGTPSIAGDPFLDSPGCTTDRLCYQLDGVHNNPFCAGLRVVPIRAQMEACP